MQPLVFDEFSSNDHSGFFEIVVLLLLTKPVGLISLEERNTVEEY